MGRTAISKKRRKSATHTLIEYVPFQDRRLADAEAVAETLFDCLLEGDVESFREVLVVHILTVNKSNLARRSGLGRQTIYDIMDFNKKFNPELSTLAALFKGLKAS